MSPVPTKAADHFSETEIDDEVVVMSLSSGDFFSLTGTARAIWQLIDGTRDIDTLVAELATGFAADPATVRSDIEAFLTDLRQAGLLRDD